MKYIKNSRLWKLHFTEVNSNMLVKDQIKYWANMLNEAFPNKSEIKKINFDDAQKILDDAKLNSDAHDRIKLYKLYDTYGYFVDSAYKFLFHVDKNFIFPGYYCIINIISVNSDFDSFADAFNALSEMLNAPLWTGNMSPLVCFTRIKGNLYDEKYLDHVVKDGLYFFNGLYRSGLNYFNMLIFPDFEYGESDLRCNIIFNDKCNKEMMERKLEDVVSYRFKVKTTNSKTSYFSIWSQKNKKMFDDQKIDDALLKFLDEKISSNKEFISRFSQALKTNENNQVDFYNDNKGSIQMFALLGISPSDVWDLIPADLYAKIVQRQVLVQQRKSAYGIQLKTIQECFDKICYDYQLLMHFSEKITIDNRCKNIQTLSKSMPKFIKALSEKLTSDLLMSQNVCKSIKNVIFACCSYIPYDAPNDEGNYFPVFETSETETMHRIKKKVESVPYDAEEDQLIAAISEIIDEAHYRGSLAWVFVEGGPSTCNKVSNMKVESKQIPLKLARHKTVIQEALGL